MPSTDASLPTVVYANHNHFLDGHLLWLVARTVFERPFRVWMEEFDRFPFFAAIGAMPFSPDDPAARVATIRRTVATFRTNSSVLLGYFPSGHLSAPELDLPAVDPRTFVRLNRLMGPANWLPLAIHVTWWGEAKPTALVAPGEPHQPPGHEMENLADALAVARVSKPAVSRVLLEGRPGPNEKWDFSFLQRFF